MTFIDSYHGLKTKAGDKTVANWASCHGVHKILPVPIPNPASIPTTLKKHAVFAIPNITPEMASVPIHGFLQEAAMSKASKVIRNIYILAIVVIIGMMFLHWLIDLIKQIILVMRKPKVKRMRVDEVIQHALLMVSFIILVITGFALRYGDAWFAKALFGWDEGFAARGIIHRVAAVIMIISTLAHDLSLTKRGRQFFKDMLPKFYDFTDFLFRVLYNLGLYKKGPFQEIQLCGEGRILGTGLGKCCHDTLGFDSMV